ncbi:hypothetical protein Egran_00821 [Elaphomyces granulatus]|nr:hypothetical protein Egran_00821 [Elaphomyces granulatus]
MALDSRS